MQQHIVVIVDDELVDDETKRQMKQPVDLIVFEETMLSVR